MVPIPFEVTAARVVFTALLVAYALVEAGIRIVSRRNASGTPARERASYVALVVVLVLSIGGALCLAAAVPFAAIPVARVGFFVVGTVLIVLGIALRIWSVVVLGRAFTVEVRVRAGQEVVDRGPYRVVRHPSYTGLLLVLLGTGIALGNGLALVVAVVPPIAAVVYRIRVEEEALLTGIGEPYRRYAEGRKRLVPFVW